MDPDLSDIILQIFYILSWTHFCSNTILVLNYTNFHRFLLMKNNRSKMSTDKNSFKVNTDSKFFNFNSDPKNKKNIKYGSDL